jgi:Tfp pilus assembly protein PilF
VTVVALLLVVIAFGCWLAVEGSRAKSSLEQARVSAQQAKDALLKGDVKNAAEHVNEAESSAQRARDATHSLAVERCVRGAVARRPVQDGSAGI